MDFFGFDGLFRNQWTLPSVAGLPSLPVFRVDYPFFTTSTRLPVLKNFYPFWEFRLPKQIVDFTGKYQHFIKVNTVYFHLAAVFG